MNKLFNNHFFIAHRGLHNSQFPENSLGAFENAINNNYAFEIDVHMLNDGTIVVHHDTNLLRSCNQNKSLYDLNGEDLKNCYIFNSSYTIPTLQNVFDLTQGKVPILIEIKDFIHKNEIVKLLMQMIKNYDGQVAIQSYHPLILKKCYKSNKNIKLSYLCSKLDDLQEINKIVKKITYSLMFYKLSKAQYISIKKDEIIPKILNKAKGNIIPWVIENEEEILTFKNISKGIIFEHFLPKQ